MNSNSRRLLLQRLAIGLATAPLLSVAALASRRAFAAAALPPLAESDPAARAQGYVEDAKRAQGAESGAECSNCSVYGGTEGASAGPCTVFPGKSVRAAGWCKAWSSL